MDARAMKDGPGNGGGAQATPMMEQYASIKAQYPDCLLFYRMGDFYELFFDDAVVAANVLSITLTHRGKHFGQDIPMAGVPIHAADEYLERLIASGHRVAVCEQTEDPAEAKKRGAKAVVRREVVRLVTPGTLTEERLLDPTRGNPLIALSEHGGGSGEPVHGIATVDISTGRFEVTETAPAHLEAELHRIAPSEVLIPQKLEGSERLKPVLAALGAPVTALADSVFDGVSAPGRIARHYGVATVEGFGTFHRAELSAAAAALSYVEETQLGRRPPLDRPRRLAPGRTMAIDAASRASLEILLTQSGERAPTLFSAVDRTVSAPGAQLLAERLAAPSADVAEIVARQDRVAALIDRPALRADLRAVLKTVPDVARALTRLVLERGGPRDLAAAGRGVAAAVEACGLIAAEGGATETFAEEMEALGAAPGALAGAIAAALVERPPVTVRDGGFIADGYDGELDEARRLGAEGRKVMADLQARYAAETGVKALKVRYNAVLGWFVEVPAAHGERLSKLADGDGARLFRHRQTMANAMRFSTDELATLEERILTASSRAEARELALFEALADEVREAAEPIRQAARALAAIDVAASFAELSETAAYVRPTVDDTTAFRIEGGRHPVVEAALARDGATTFVPNDCDLSSDGREGDILLVTGPNMGGKSTFLRQNALIAILAQAGGTVPAASARIGVVDRLFSRIGASDDLARGRSTFMVEMVETAAILNQASPRSLVILDEIGRGTSTFDGLSIAWAALEHLHDASRCRALFATHYHELTALAERMARIRNATMRVKEWRGEVIFLHEVTDGAADRSYGIQVAKLAGLPPTVVARAAAVLKRLEASGRSVAPAAVIDDLPLFSHALAAPGAADEGEAEADPALALLDGADPDDMTPREALDLLYALKRARRGAD